MSDLLDDVLAQSHAKYTESLKTRAVDPKPEAKQFVSKQPAASSQNNGIWGDLKEDDDRRPWREYSKSKGLDWGVEKVPIAIPDRNGGWKPVKIGKFAIVRKDTGEELGIVGKGYSPQDNEQIFAPFDSLVQSKQAAWVGAGSFDNGARVWSQINANWSSEVVPGDKVRYYGFSAGSHNGDGKIVYSLVSVRVNCINTYMLAIRQGDKIASIKHTSGAKAAIEAVSELMQSMVEKVKEETELYQRMAARRASTEEIREFLRQIVPDPDDTAAKKAMTMRAKQRDDILDVIKFGKGQREPGVQGTAWAVWNGITEYIDHVKAEDADDKLEYVMSGGGKLLKNQYREQLLESFDLAAK
jgi:phage/plasmid-like protein (TIGR03299 family)